MITRHTIGPIRVAMTAFVIGAIGVAVADRAAANACHGSAEAASFCQQELVDAPAAVNAVRGIGRRVPPL